MTEDTGQDYFAITVPEDKPTHEYHYTQRRADILRRILEAGNPYNLNQTELAEEYGVSQPTISKDFKKIGRCVDRELGRDATLITRAAFEKVTAELEEKGKYKQLWDVVMDWNEWLMERGDQHREPRGINADVTHREESTESEDYVLIQDPEDVTDAQYVESTAAALPDGDTDADSAQDTED